MCSETERQRDIILRRVLNSGTSSEKARVEEYCVNHFTFRNIRILADYGRKNSLDKMVDRCISDMNISERSIGAYSIKPYQLYKSFYDSLSSRAITTLEAYLVDDPPFDGIELYFEKVFVGLSWRKKKEYITSAISKKEYGAIGTLLFYASGSLYRVKYIDAAMVSLILGRLRLESDLKGYRLLVRYGVASDVALVKMRLRAHGDASHLFELWALVSGKEEQELESELFNIYCK